MFTLFFANSALAQGAGSWNILNVKYNINDNWSVFTEGQLRSLKFYNHFHYYEYKAGFNYKLYNNVKLGLGAGNYSTYKEGGNFVLPKNNEEFRIWAEVALTENLRKLKIDHRYRAEFRFTSNGFRNRFRYRIGAWYPFGKQIKGFSHYLISISNEIFFTNKEPYFERNRLLLSLQYKFSKALALQIGFLNQFDYKINDETGRDFLQVGLFYEIFQKKSSGGAKNIKIDND